MTCLSRRRSRAALVLGLLAIPLQALAGEPPVSLPPPSAPPMSTLPPPEPPPPPMSPAPPVDTNAPPAPPPPPPADTAPPPPPVTPPPAPPSPEKPAPPGDALADTDPRSRELGGHLFSTPSLLETAFIGTSIHASGELGWYLQPGIHVTAIDESGISRIFQYDRRLGIQRERFGASAALKPYLALDFDGSYTTLFGGDDESIFLYGNSSAWEVRPGARLELYRNPGSGTQLTVRAYAHISAGQRLRPGAITSEIAREIGAISQTQHRVDCLRSGDFSCVFDNTFDPIGAVLVKRHEAAGGAALSWAQAFAGGRAGLQATAGLEIGGATQTTLDTGDVASLPITVYAGLAPEVSLAPLPLSAMLEYRFTVVAESFGAGKDTLGGSSTSFQHGLGGGVFYTGKKDIEVGLGLNASLISTALGGDSGSGEPLLGIVTGRLSMKYYF